METLSHCPICSSNAFSNFLKCKDYTVSKKEFQIVSCDSCGFKFTNPRPEENELGKYYESEEYISHSNTEKGFVNKLYQIARHYTLSKKLQLVTSVNKGSGTILDYGCGTGEFLNTCKSGGWKTIGIEPSKLGREQGKSNYGLELHSDIFGAPLQKEQFDVITLWHVLEHVSKLNETIERILHLLKVNGTLIIAVPNPASKDAAIYGKYWAAYDVPRHLYHFTPDSMANLLKRHSQKISKIKPMVLDSFYVSMLSEKYISEDTDKKSMFSLPKAFWNGLRSNINAIMNPGTSSSQIYIVSKTS